MCGYKRTHPLEDKILFLNIMNNNDGLEELEKRNSIIQVFKDCCDELKNLYYRNNDYLLRMFNNV